MKDFVHLHLHSEYSFLDGMCRAEEIAESTRRMKMPAVAITDHGNLHGVVSFYEAAWKHGVKPIIGSEMYLAPGNRKETRSKSGEENFFHLTILAKDQEGYQNLVMLSTLSWLEGFYYKPRIDKELLSRYAKGLVVLSGCLKGEIAWFLGRGEEEKAEKSLKTYIDILGKDDFYLELMDNGIPLQKEVNTKLLSLAKKYDLSSVATNDCHYLRQEDSYAHDILLCIQTKSTIEDPNRLRLPTDQFYFRSPEEMESLFREVPDSLSSTVEISEKCNVTFSFGSYRIPVFKVPRNISAEEYLEEMVEEGFREKYGCSLSESRDIAATERTRKELEVIKSMNFSGYFLIIQDIVAEAKRRAIPVGPGRGSAAGSMIAYLLGITEINPLDYQLIFERFLNPERISMPDIDLDFSDQRREEITAYIREKYGEDHVAQIVTFGTLSARSALHDVGRVMNMGFSERGKMINLLSRDLDIKLSYEAENNKEIRQLIGSDERVRQLFHIAQILEGLSRQVGTHAAGIVISDEPLTTIVPLFKGPQGNVTQFEMKSVEKIGLLKIDILGLQTLSVIDETIALVRERKGIVLTEFPSDDPVTYQMLGEGRSKGLFQIESQGMQDLLLQMKPSCFDDLIAILALYRPGPRTTGMIQQFLSYRKDSTRIAYDHPLLEPILKPTYGAILYQEQVMQIANEVGGFTMGQADILRKAMGKKDPELLEQQREKFVEGAKHHAISSKLANSIFSNMAKFGSYGFNKSHSAGYAMITYRTAWLKANHPLEFMTSLLNGAIGDSVKMAEYIEEAERMNIWVLPPDIHESRAEMSVVGNDILFGLAAIKNVGTGAIQNILEVRKEGPFENLFDFCRRVDLHVVNKKMIESLIKSGAFDCFERPRSQLYAAMDEAMDQASKLQKLHEDGQLSIFSKVEHTGISVDEEAIATLPEWPDTKLLAYEREMIGVYRSGHPLENSRELLSYYVTATTDQADNLSEEEEYWFGGFLEQIERKSTRKGGKMAVALFEDQMGRIETIFFPKVYELCSNLLKTGEILFIRGRIDRREEKIKLVASEVATLNTISEKNNRKLQLDLDTSSFSENLMKELRDLFVKYRGNCMLLFLLRREQADSVRVVLPRYPVSIHPEFLFALEQRKEINEIKVI